MKNKLIDLNNHLFAQLERLGDEDLSTDELQKEVSRTTAIVDVSSQIIENSNIAIKAAKLVAEYGGNYEKMLPLVEGKKEINNDQPSLAAPKVKKI